MEKLHSYQGWSGRYHEWRENLRVRYANWREEHPETFFELVKKVARDQGHPSAGQRDPPDEKDDEFSHINR